MSDGIGIFLQIRQEFFLVTLACLQAVVVMVPAAVAAHFMAAGNKTAQQVLGHRIVVQVPSLGVAVCDGIRAGCHVN